MPLRWVHLTDLHVGKPDEARRAALRSLVGELSKAIGNESIDAVFLTGDLAYSGRAAEYDELHSLVIEPLRRLPAFSSSRFIAVPGNHDLDCDKVLPSPWASLGHRRQHLFFQDTSEGRTTRAARALGFSDYAAFLARHSIEGPDPTHCCSTSLSLLARDGTHVEVIGVVTAFFSDKEVTDEHLAPAPTPALRTQLDRMDQSKRVIVLGHHPPSWFMHASQEPLRALLYQRDALYLHGHEHRIKVDSTKKGLRILGFGAAYQASLDNTTPSFYENTFAICLLDTSLHVAIHSWDQNHGTWRPQTKLPAEFDQDSTQMRGAYVFSLASDESQKHSVKKQERQRLPPLPMKAYLLDPRPDRMAWEWFLKLAGLIPEHIVVDDKQIVIGQHDVIEMIIPNGASTLRLRCIPGHGHVLSAREVEVENTRMDTEGYESVALVTFGEMADDARLLGLQLERRKSFRTCSQSDLAKSLNARMPREISEYIERLDAADAMIAHVLGLQRWFFLVQDRLRAEWFYVIDEKAQRLESSDETVAMLRRQRPELTTARYLESDAAATPGVNPTQPFDRAAYVAKCRQEFHTLKYDALAALGVRFPSASVEHLYVPASADVGDVTGSSTAYRQAINDILDSFNLDDAQRAQLESQLREGMPGLMHKETGAARSLYQQHGNVLVLGDPGSGKTCFLKNEVLSYCNQSESDTWYKYHVPVFVPLVEAAAIPGDLSIVEICAQLTSRRGLPLSSGQLSDLMTNGHVAFFFDGLDEVPSIDQRAKFVEHIGNLIVQQGPLGNRVVLTSRPAAVHLLKMPRRLVTLHLRGLTDSEMRILATKVLSVERATGDKLRLSATLPSEEEALLERLLEDCRNNPGIRRIARNPLLLTLLVMIYANSGPLAAKRHRIYSQAVQTLVSVRNRDAKQQVLSEADLRHRLGAVALETYRALGVEIPTVEWVCTVIARSLKRNPDDHDVMSILEHFVQLVAEATGLLVIHKRGETSSNSTVSFLHHSFLEYYAAVGFIESQPIEQLPALTTHSRWREVITIIAGLLADQSDSTRLVRTLAASVDEGDDITLERLLFAFDCALEADVPTEETQELLVTQVAQAMNVLGIVDSGLRKELADRLGRLLGASGSPRVKILLAAGVRSVRVEEAAAYIELAGRIGEKVDVGADVIAALTAACGRPQPEIRGAILGTIERMAEMRNPEGIKALREGLQGGMTVRYAAVRALDAVPALTKECWSHVKACLADSQAAIAGTAARALMAAGIHIDLTDRADRGFLELCLRRWARMGDAEEAYRSQLKTNREQLDELLSSPVSEDRLLGLRLLPLLDREERYVYERILEIVNSEKNRNEIVAALESLRLSRGALGLITMADVDSLGSLLESDYRDIRISAARALAAHPSPDAVVSRLLREYAKGCKGSELRAAVRALVQVAEDDNPSREYLFSSCNRQTSYALAHSFGDEAVQRELEVLLQACEELGGEGTETLEDNLTKLADSYRAPKRLRQRALHALARISVPSSSRIAYFVKILNGNDPVLGPPVGRCIVDFVRSCRQRVDNVRAVVSELGGLETALIRRWYRIVKSTGQLHLDDPGLSGIRAALREVRELVVAYGEFAGRKRIAAN